MTAGMQPLFNHTTYNIFSSSKTLFLYFHRNNSLSLLLTEGKVDMLWELCRKDEPLVREQLRTV